jgi:hypothetical protein
MNPRLQDCKTVGIFISIPKSWDLGEKVIDVSQYPVLDHHCHAFLPEKEEAKGELFAQFFSWSPVPLEQSENLILFRKILIELKRILGTILDRYA